MAKQKKDIQDFLKPQNGRVRQGYFVPRNPEKYKGDPTKIIYRSSWEFKFLSYCDSSESVVEYSSEPVGIPYWNPILKKESRYFIDCYMATRDPSGNINRWLIEIKPNKYLNPPEAPKILTEKKTLDYVRHAKLFVINKAKFEAAKAYAAKNNMKFGIITENFLFNNM